MRPGWTKPKAWTRADDRYLTRFYATRALQLLARELRRTPVSVKSRASRLRISKGRRHFTPEEDAVLEAQYPHRPTDEVAKLLGRKVFSVYARATKLDLHKTTEYMASLAAIEAERLVRTGAAHRFKPGQVPANKGLRRPGYSIGRSRMAETTFKKGHKPRNLIPVGTIKANSDGYLRIKVSYDRPGLGGSDQNWEFVHKRVWEAAHGPIPKGHRIWWKDRNHENCALENLELLSDKEHMARTTIHRMPPELKGNDFMAGSFEAKDWEARTWRTTSGTYESICSKRSKR
jgi:hypothetical protein